MCVCVCVCVCVLEHPWQQHGDAVKTKLYIDRSDMQPDVRFSKPGSYFLKDKRYSSLQ